MLGGSDNTASSQFLSVSGGKNNTASGIVSSVSGTNRYQRDDYGWSDGP